jgi:hypothetical protein
VVWDDFYNGSNDFNGIMLTHSVPNDYFANIRMDTDHFETGYEVVFDNTHFVNQVLVLS